ncbi:MAG TPA: FAD-linked oxidase C-terminal domain-containing protein [Candidatus Baltobacteraceae bacterium]|nr:FAD-linked oxidase C-terminal domain-containing protein [Candidatus Baltobacteraceae bacterium]
MSTGIALPPALVEELRSIVGTPNVLFAEEDLLAYAYDGTWYESRPLVVVLPDNRDQISAIHRVASREKLAITPRAMGSGLSGGAVPLAGSILLNVMRMNRIIEIDEINHVAVVGPGVINADLQKAVEARGLFYPPDPSSLRQSAIGGNVAENAGGARCLKYGVTGDYVAALEVVLPGGEIIRCGGKMVKNVTGYDLRALFTGSEGTLGTVTEITLRLLPKPKFSLTATAAFDHIEDAAACVTRVMASGLLPTSIELLDQLTMRCVEDFRTCGLPSDAAALLLFACDGNHEQIIRGEIEEIGEVAIACKARGIRVAADAIESARLWDGRRSIAPALARRRPHRLGEDISVPRSALVEMVCRVHEIADRHRLEIPIYGHAGDGNLHPNILCDRSNGEEMLRVREAAREIFETAIALGGTLSGEHGIGLLKKQFMEMDLGIPTLALMRRIKDAIDPLGIMNPGKIFPEPGGVDAFRL